MFTGSKVNYWSHLLLQMFVSGVSVLGVIQFILQSRVGQDLLLHITW